MTVVTYKIVELHYIFKEHAQIYQKRDLEFHLNLIIDARTGLNLIF